MAYQRLLLIHPWIPARFNGTPMGLLYLATLAQNAGHEVRVIDMQALGPNIDLRSEIALFQPTIVGVSSTSPSHPAAMEILRVVKEQSSDILTVSGGVHETYCARDTLAWFPQVDFAFVGECEYPFIKFLSSISNPGLTTDIPALAYRSDGQIRVNRTDSTRIDLDALPIPNRCVLHMAERYNFRIFNYELTTQVQTTRGCPFPCSFCNQRNRIPLVRSIQSILDEITYLHSRGYRAIFFDDATFTMDRRRTLELSRCIKALGISINMACQTRAELVDDELLQAMAEAGFSYISFGLETTDANALKAVLKVRSVDKHIAAAQNAVKSCRRSSIRSCLNVIVGFQNETMESLDCTFEHVRALEPSFVSISALAKYPHEAPGLSEIYRQGVSLEGIWQYYDEGYGALHPYLAPERAEQALDLARARLGTLLEVT